MSTFEQRKSALLQRLGAFPDASSRANHLIAAARDLSPFGPELRIDAHRVEGCTSNLWLVAELREGMCRFRCDSDSAVVRALAGVLCELCDGLAPSEIVAADVTFLRGAGLSGLFSGNRRNALSHLWTAMRAFAERAPTPEFCDAHNHLQDERFAGRQDELLAAARSAGIRRMVVNGSCEEDWPQVSALAHRFPDVVIPAFGIHPWYVHQRTSDWERRLVECLDAVPSSVGEIGLDRWKKDLPWEGQEEVFSRQMAIAAERNVPATIHCLQAWGRLVELLEQGTRPACGFLLHSYGGSVELVDRLAALGAYFSLPGWFARDGKDRQREAFRHVPRERLLIETDAPDQSPPDAEILHALTDASTGRPLNHPANLPAIYAFAARLRAEPVEQLTRQIRINFRRLFGV